MKHQIRAVLTSMHKDPDAMKELHKGCIERFVPVQDEDYDDIRAMFQRVQALTEVALSSDTPIAQTSSTDPVMQPLDRQTCQNAQVKTE
ncbi:MAG: hypothetical protein JO011_07785 [Ktedonobacteraceae bacterium]|nr:hypothetical protein [Ktedonobacteraceae bacterium]